MAAEHKCTKCGGTEFEIEVTRTATVEFLRNGDHEVHDDAHGDTEWSDDSHAECTKCGYASKLGRMIGKGRKTKEPAIQLFNYGPGASAGVRVVQNGINKFTVSYGLQVKGGLNYERAAQEFGYAVFHALSLTCKIDNRTKGE